jgi:hypothetical protein
MQSILEVSSAALAKIDKNDLPDGFASGCLMDYHGRRLLLTVAHATHSGPPLALSLGWDADKRRVKLWRLGALNFLALGQLDTGMEIKDMSLREIDFAYVDVPPDVEPRLEKIDAATGNILESRLCTVWSATAISEPKADVQYGFAGHTKQSLEGHHLIAPDVKFCFSELRVCFPLAFVGTEDDLLAFQLPVEHPGHEYFYGCSGAPIIDADGHVVALVCKGDMETSTVFGISLRRYQIALDIHIGRFP